ncbi:MAG: ATP-binding protein [Betaproteobacteria bacterium]
MGLAIVKTFIEAHGGTVAVESKQGFGSTFRFSLPGKAAVSDQTEG